MDLKGRISYIAKHYGLSIRGFEAECGLLRGNISNMTGAIGSDKLAKIIDRFNEVNLYWLLSEIGEPFITKTTENLIKANDKVFDKVFDKVPKLQKTLSNIEAGEKTKTTENIPKQNGDKFGDIPKLHKLSPNIETGEKNENYGKCNTSDVLQNVLQSVLHTKTTKNVTLGEHIYDPQIISLDSLLSIPVVDISAAAGIGCFNDDYIDQTNIISLPRYLFKKRVGQRFCIKIMGYSMYPTLSPESYIVIRQLERGEWGYIKDDRIYVITDTEGKTVVKRVLNDLYDSGLLRCISDNPDKVQYFDFAIPEAEIGNVFEVELYFTADLNAINNVVVKQMTDQAEMAGIKLDIQDLKQAILDIQRKL